MLRRAGLARDALHILGLGPFVAVDYLKTDVFSFVQGFVALPQNRRMVDENILSGFLGDKTETAFVVEPFDFSTGHNLFLPCLSATMKVERPSGQPRGSAGRPKHFPRTSNQNAYRRQ